MACLTAICVGENKFAVAASLTFAARQPRPRRIVGKTQEDVPESVSGWQRFRA